MKFLQARQASAARGGTSHPLGEPLDTFAAERLRGRWFRPELFFKGYVRVTWFIGELSSVEKASFEPQISGDGGGDRHASAVFGAFFLGCWLQDAVCSLNPNTAKRTHTSEPHRSHSSEPYKPKACVFCCAEPSSEVESSQDSSANPLLPTRNGRMHGWSSC